MATDFLRPDADTSDGNWTNESGNNTNLFDSINETSASDSDYIRSGPNPVNDVCKIQLSNPSGSTPQEPMDVLYRYKKTGTGIIDLRVRLLQGTTQIASWTHTNISSSYVDGSQTLTTPQFNSISDFNDLFLEFRATLPAPILDQISASATAAWSTRKLRAAYAGSCLRVRRSSDNTELDIGFSGNGLDSAALLTFVGANNGFITLWYDQSGNGRNLEQTTAGAQPKIISSGSLVTLNGNPAMDLDGTDDTLIGISGVDFNTLFNTLAQYTVLSGSRGRAAGPGTVYNAAAVVGGSISHLWQGYGITTIEIGHYPAAGQAFSVSLPETVIMVSRFDGTSDLLEAWKNGGSSSDDTAAPDILSNQTLQIGSSSLGGFLNALVCEVFCFGSPITLSDINILGDSMAIYIGPTWTTAT